MRIPDNPGEGACRAYYGHQDAVPARVQVVKRRGDRRFGGGGQVRRDSLRLRVLGDQRKNMVAVLLCHLLVFRRCAGVFGDQALRANLGAQYLLVEGDIFGSFAVGRIVALVRGGYGAGLGFHGSPG